MKHYPIISPKNEKVESDPIYGKWPDVPKKNGMRSRGKNIDTIIKGVSRAGQRQGLFAKYAKMGFGGKPKTDHNIICKKWELSLPMWRKKAPVNPDESVMGIVSLKTQITK